MATTAAKYCIGLGSVMTRRVTIGILIIRLGYWFDAGKFEQLGLLYPWNDIRRNILIDFSSFSLSSCLQKIVGLPEYLKVKKIAECAISFYHRIS